MRQDIHGSEVPVLCRACEARHCGVCGVLAPEQLVRLAMQAVRLEFGPGAELAAAGDEVRRYANLLSSVVKLAMMMPDGRQQIVGLRVAPDFLGRPFEGVSEFSAEAASTLGLCAFPKEVLEAVVRESLELWSTDCTCRRSESSERRGNGC